MSKKDMYKESWLKEALDETVPSPELTPEQKVKRFESIKYQLSRIEKQIEAVANDDYEDTRKESVRQIRSGLLSIEVLCSELAGVEFK